MNYVYILALSNKKLYTGSTVDIKKRLEQHYKGKVTSTKSFRPLQLIHYEAYIKESDARRREKFLKSTEGKRLLRKQIRDYLNEIGYSR